jgi:hypothetical protein
MAKKKRKKTTRLRARLHALQPLAIVAISTTFLGLALVTHSAPVKHTASSPKAVAVTSPAPEQQTSTSAPAKSPAATTTPSPTPSVVKSTPTPVTHATIPQSTKPEPVVTPSPSSSVSSLAPVTTTPSSSSGGSATAQSAPAAPTTTGYTSTNWSGYMATTGSFSAITGSWTVPTVTGPAGETSADSAWIGIGGVSSSDLIQVGTEDSVSPSGQASYAGFYELLPESSITIPNLSVNAGDQMSAVLTEVSTGEWTITITDLTNNESFTINKAYSSSNSSAEWIEEDPSYSFRRQIPFDTFGSVAFSSGSTVTNNGTVNIAGSSAEPVTMVNQSDSPVATPSSLSGSSFSVVRN